MEEDYVSYELAKKLRAAGFIEPCGHYYCAFDNETDVRFWSIHPPQSQNGFTNPEGKVIADAPTLWGAWKWLRYEKNIDVEVNSNTENYEIVSYEWSLFWMSPCDLIDNADDSYASYEEALEAGMMRAVEMLLSGELTEDDDE